MVKKKKEEVKKKLPATVRTCIYICVKKPVEKRFRGQTHSRYTAQITLMLFKKYIYIFMYICVCVCVKVTPRIAKGHLVALKKGVSIAFFSASSETSHSKSIFELFGSPKSRGREWIWHN